jgi:hypothetical protein
MALLNIHYWMTRSVCTGISLRPVVRPIPSPAALHALLIASASIMDYGFTPGHLNLHHNAL